MILDLRIPMGLMFTLVGLILTVFGLVTNHAAMYDRTDQLNINLIWGLVLLVFGLTMYLLGRRGQKIVRSLPPEPETEDHGHRSHH